jgi:hypothetical protein
MLIGFELQRIRQELFLTEDRASKLYSRKEYVNYTEKAIGDWTIGRLEIP